MTKVLIAVLGLFLIGAGCRAGLSRGVQIKPTPGAEVWDEGTPEFVPSCGSTAARGGVRDKLVAGTNRARSLGQPTSDRSAAAAAKRQVTSAMSLSIQSLTEGSTAPREVQR